MKSIQTKFPSEIDSRIFFIDVDLSQVPIMKNYYTLINAGEYSRASELLNNSEVSFYGAWILNLLENRLCAIGNYVMGLEKNKLMTYSNSEPSNDEIYEGMNWID